MRSTTFTVRVDSAAKKRLKRLGKSTGRSRSFLAAEAINEYLDSTSGRLPASSGLSRLSTAAKGLRINRLRIGSHPGTAVKSDRSSNARDPGLVARGDR